jgi:metal-dependent amidase/aminoacylase/carboxypeptidase family protein
MSIPGDIKALADEMTAWRRHLHQNPELSGQEKSTALFIEEKLTSFGLTPQRLGGYGVVATLQGKTNTTGKAIMLRADTDALPILEETGLPYVSQNPGVMHACGHDGHTAMLLGAAKYLQANNDFDGSVHFLFQPAEETGKGAPEMLEEGLFEKFPTDSIYGLHNFPLAHLGIMGTATGDFLSAEKSFSITLSAASALQAASHSDNDGFTVRLSGVGGHASNPWLATDLIGAATDALEGTGTDPHSPSVTALHTSSTATNVMPASVTISGTAATARQREILRQAFAQKPGGFFAKKARVEISFGASTNPEAPHAFMKDAARLVKEIKDEFINHRPEGDDQSLLTMTALHTSSALGAAGGMTITGTMRSFEPEAIPRFQKFMEDKLNSLAGIETRIDYGPGFAKLSNSPTETKIALKAARSMLGIFSFVTGRAKRTMGTEDFAALLEKKPGNYMILGTSSWKNIFFRKGMHSLHSPKFDFNDCALPYGAAYWVALTKEALPRPGKSTPQP